MKLVDPTAKRYVEKIEKAMAAFPDYVRENPEPRMSFGNTKTQKTCGVVWDVPALFTCPGASGCAKNGYCYAMQHCYTFEAKVRSMAENLLAIDKAVEDRDYRKVFIGRVTRQIAESEAETLRIHTSGDFKDQGHVDVWVDVIENLERFKVSIKVYAYTKSLHLDFSRLEKKCNIVQSEGGKFDHLLDFSKPNARIFKSLEDLKAAGYEDSSETDEHAIKGTVKVGLIARPGTGKRFSEAKKAAAAKLHAKCG